MTLQLQLPYHPERNTFFMNDIHRQLYEKHGGSGSFINCGRKITLLNYYTQINDFTVVEFLGRCSVAEHSWHLNCHGGSNPQKVRKPSLHCDTFKKRVQSENSSKSHVR